MDILRNIRYNEPVSEFNCPVIGSVQIKCLLKHKLPKDNLTLITTTLVSSIDEDSLRSCLTLADSLIISFAIRKHIQLINPCVDLLSNAEFIEFKDTITRQLKTNKLECSKFNLVDSIVDFYGLPIVRLSDSRVFIYIEAKKLNRI